MTCIHKATVRTLTHNPTPTRSTVHEKFVRVRANGAGAIDIHWRSLQETGNWFALWPAGGEQSTSYSDIERRTVDYSEVPQ